MTDAAPMFNRQCGDCALCCKLPAIRELNKPAGQWCVHCASHQGCSAYETRPTPCRTFNCLYLVDDTIGEEWRPTRARMHLSLTQEPGKRALMLAMVDPSRPDAWKRTPYYLQLKQWSERFSVMISIGERRIMLFPDHDKDLGLVPEGAQIDMVPGDGFPATAVLRMEQ